MKKDKEPGFSAMSIDMITDEEYRKMEIDVLARTIWGEAGTEKTADMVAIALVVINRHAVSQRYSKFWWGNNPIQICQKPYQFTCWNRSSPNYKNIREVNNDDASFDLAVSIATRALEGVLYDTTKGATHYALIGEDPYWAKNKKRAATVGRREFYKLD